MAYKPTTREITIEFRPSKGPTSRQEVIVTPQYAEVRSGDTIVWTVQGAPKAAEVSVAHFTFYGDPVTLSFRRGRVVVGRPALLRDALLEPKGSAKNLKIKTRGCEPGQYKYDVMVDGKTVLDPDVEIRGPKGG